ncbi:hypothetical protein, partial [Prolixibacter denitrificans]|uniref:hypothetical protein n=1 Tax=Prolixibacter denitrificans TaxID=1541063 RepID=UPI001B80CF20
MSICLARSVFSSKRKLNFWCLSSFLFNIFNELVFFLNLRSLLPNPSVAVGRAEKSVAKIEIFSRYLQIFFRLFLKASVPGNQRPFF